MSFRFFNAQGKKFLDYIALSLLYKLISFLLIITSFDPPTWIRYLGFHYFLTNDNNNSINIFNQGQELTKSNVAQNSFLFFET